MRVIPLTSVLLAFLAEVALAWTWLMLDAGKAPGMTMALWIWPLVWIACVIMGVLARPAAHTLNGDHLAVWPMIRSLLAHALLVLTPAIVFCYAAMMCLIALRVTGS